MSAVRYPVVELRQYTLRPGQRDVLIDLFDREFVESQEADGMAIVGQFRDLDDPDRFMWIRGFASMPARARALASFYGGPAWKAHSAAANATMIDSDNVLLLRPVTARSGFPAPAAARPPAGQAPRRSRTTRPRRPASWSRCTTATGRSTRPSRTSSTARPVRCSPRPEPRRWHACRQSTPRTPSPRCRSAPARTSSPGSPASPARRSRRSPAPDRALRQLAGPRAPRPVRADHRRAPAATAGPHRPIPAPLKRPSHTRR